MWGGDSTCVPMSVCGGVQLHTSVHPSMHGCVHRDVCEYGAVCMCLCSCTWLCACGCHVNAKCHHLLLQ